jgi:hypothetical protein
MIVVDHLRREGLRKTSRRDAWPGSGGGHRLPAMRAMVVYESMFGNTFRVAEAIADGLRPSFEVEIREVGSAVRHDVGLDLLVVGGPIHGWRMARGWSFGCGRAYTNGIGIREFLTELHEPNRDPPPLAAAFDTLLRTRWFPTGSAARPAASQLVHHGYRLIAEPQHFYVEDARGPLVAGELERAFAWGTQLARAG